MEGSSERPSIWPEAELIFLNSFPDVPIEPVSFRAQPDLHGQAYELADRSQRNQADKFESAPHQTREDLQVL